MGSSPRQLLACACACMLLFLSDIVHAQHIRGRAQIYNVMAYGAVADGKTDNSMAFLRAWKDACEWNGRSRVLIPPGTYLLNTVSFNGPCKGSMTFLNKGVLKASTSPSSLNSNTWIGFRYLQYLALKGGGVFDGQGAAAWSYNDCLVNSNCIELPISLRFDFVNNSRIRNIRSINSKNAHINIFACNHMNVSNIRLTAPDESPNTDGIKIGGSTDIKISDSIIATGDDCLAILSGSQDIEISQVSCGPGHGISVGSIGRLGADGMPEYVKGISIRDSTFMGTQNGLRIKTWAPSNPGLVEGFKFENIRMVDVFNPIVVDQNYCPAASCDPQAQSSVQIRYVTFKNIWGTSLSRDAIQLKCSGMFHCQQVQLADIALSYTGPDGPAKSLCYNVDGVAYGRQSPSGCL